MGSKLSNLLQLFRSVLPARNMEDLEQRLLKAQEKKDLPEMAKIYYDMGVHCMKNDDANRARMYLSRCDSIYSSDDDVYEKVKKSIREDCSERLGELEELPLLTNEIPQQIEEQAEELSDVQIRLWGLMTMARLVQVGKRLSHIAGCEVLGDLDEAVDVILRSFQEPVSQADFQFLTDVCDELYDLGDDEFAGQVEVPGGAPFQVFDLDGLLVATELNLYFDSHLRLLSEGPEDSPTETGMIACALLPDYYLRTCKEDLASLPQILQEVERIQADYEFVSSQMTWEGIAQRIVGYKELDILAG